MIIKLIAGQQQPNSSKVKKKWGILRILT